MGQNLIFKTDREFCGSDEVRVIMEGRRRHEDCGTGQGGCEVVRGMGCEGRRRRRSGKPWKRLGKMGWEWDWVWRVVALLVAVGLWLLSVNGAFANSMLCDRWCEGFRYIVRVS